MSKKLFQVLTLVVVLSLALAACGGNDTGGAKVTSSGFACPEPEYKMEVTSKELNIFVWTEYIPTDAIECFELIYGVKVNHEEYSANEEMYAKLSAEYSS